MSSSDPSRCCASPIPIAALALVGAVVLAACTAGGGTPKGPPALTASSPVAVTVAVGDSVREPVVVAAGGVPPYTYALACLPALPPGLGLASGTGLLFGVPESPYSGVCDWSVSDAGEGTLPVRGDVLIEVLRRDTPPLTAEPLSSVSVEVGTSLRVPVVEAAGGVPPYLYGLACRPALPSTFRFSPESARLYGVPSAPYRGVCEWTVADADDPPVRLDGPLVVDVWSPRTAPFDATAVVSLTLSVGDSVRSSVVSASGGRRPYRYGLDCNPRLPDRLTFDTASGLLYGLPAAPYDAVCRWSASDSGPETPARTGSFPVVIGTTHAPLTATLDLGAFASAGPPKLTLMRGRPFQMRLIDAAGGAGPLTYNLSCPLPAGLAFSATTGWLSGTPTAVHHRACDWWVQDGSSPPRRAPVPPGTFTLAVVEPPVGALTASLDMTAFTPGAPPRLDLERGRPFQAHLVNASGGSGALTYRLGCTLPPGLRYSADTGWLSGTPTATYHRTCDWWVEDASSPPRRAPVPPGTFTLSVAEPTVDALTASLDMTAFTPGAPPRLDLERGRPFQARLVKASGGLGALTYRLGCALPPGLRYSADTGWLSGTPTATYHQACDWWVEDGSSPPRRAPVPPGTFTLSVAEPTVDALTASLDMTALTPGSPPRLDLERGRPFQARLMIASGGTPPLKYRLGCSLPAGVRFSTDTGWLSGTPTATYHRTCDWSVQDASTPPRSAPVPPGTFTLSVAEPASPTLSASLDMTAFTPGGPPRLDLQTGRPFQARLIKASGGSGTLTYRLGCPLPPGLSFSADTGWLSGTPTAAYYQACDWSVEDQSSPPQQVPKPPGTFVLAVTEPTVVPLVFGAPPYGTAPLHFPLNALTRHPLPPVSGGTAPYRYSLVSSLCPSCCPSWLRLDGAQLAAAPPAISSTAELCTVRVTDSASPAATDDWVVSVRAVAREFAFQPLVVPDRHLPLGQRIEPIAVPRALGSACAEDANRCPLVYRIDPPLPAGLCLSHTRRRTSPCQAGPESYELALPYGSVRAQPWIVGTPRAHRPSPLTNYRWTARDLGGTLAPVTFRLATVEPLVPRFTLPSGEQRTVVVVADQLLSVAGCTSDDEDDDCPSDFVGGFLLPGTTQPVPASRPPYTFRLPLAFLPAAWDGVAYYTLTPVFARNSRFSWHAPLPASERFPFVRFRTNWRGTSHDFAPEPLVAYVYGVARTPRARAPEAALCIDADFAPAKDTDNRKSGKNSWMVRVREARLRIRDDAQRSSTGEFLCSPRPLGDDLPATTPPGAAGATPPSNPVHEALVPFHAQTAMRNAHSAVEAYVRDVDRDQPAHGAVRLVPHVERHGISGTHRGFSFSGAGEAAAAAAGLPLDPFHAGVAVSSSTLDLAYVAGPDASPDYLRGEHTAELHSAHPFIAWRNPSGSTVWAAVGAGHGRLRHRDVLDLDSTYAWADLSLRTWGAGASVPVLATAGLPGSMALRALAEGWRLRVRPDLGSRISDALPVFTGREAALGVRWSGAARSGFSPWAGVDWRARGGAGPSGRVLGAEAGLRLSRRTPVPLRASVGGGLERAVSSGVDDRRWRLAADVALGASDAALGPGASLRAECPGRDCALRTRLGWRLPAPRPWRSVAPYVAATGGAGVSARAVGLELTAPGDSVLSVELARRASHSSGALMLRLEVPL